MGWQVCVSDTSGLRNPPRTGFQPTGPLRGYIHSTASLIQSYRLILILRRSDDRLHPLLNTGPPFSPSQISHDFGRVRPNHTKDPPRQATRTLLADPYIHSKSRNTTSPHVRSGSRTGRTKGDLRRGSGLRPHRGKPSFSCLELLRQIRKALLL